MKKLANRLLLIGILLVAFGRSGFGQVLEDFNDVSDWTVTVGTAALGGSIDTNAVEVQEGLYAGEFNYELSTAQGDDYVFYTKEFQPLLDMNDPNLRLEVYLKMPNDPAMLLQIELIDDSNAFRVIDLGEGDGQWHKVIMDYHTWANYGANLSQIKSIQFRTIGDISSNYTNNTFYVDKMELDYAAPTYNLPTLEDFEDVSDWTVTVGPAALDGSIDTNAVEAQDGLYAGALNYELSTTMGNDYVFYTKEFQPLLDMSDPNLRLEMYLKIPNDPALYSQIWLIDGNDNFREVHLNNGDGQWHRVSFDYHAWMDYGSNPNMSKIKYIRFRSLGDLPPNLYTKNTIYLDKMQLNPVDPATRFIIEDFEDVSDWGITVGGNALGGSLATSISEAQVGSYAGAFGFHHSVKKTFDTVLYTKYISLNLVGAESIDMHYKIPNNISEACQMQILDRSNRYMMYSFPEGDDQWHTLSLKIPDDFGVGAGGMPDLSDIWAVYFWSDGTLVVNPMGGAIETTGTFYIDQIVANICLASHDSNGDCFIDFIDFADLGLQWMQTGTGLSHDVNTDEKVNMTDMDEFASQWLQCGWTNVEKCY